MAICHAQANAPESLPRGRFRDGKDVLRLRPVIVLLDTPEDLDVCARELGGVEVEQLFTPLTRRKPQKPEQRFAMDNGAFASFSSSAFVNLLNRHHERMALCRWVAVPDVVADARRTLEVFHHWRGRNELSGWPLAFVCQDGQEHLPIPWTKIEAIFIGGSTDWKMSNAASACIKAAKAIGKWVHVGRVNTAARMEHFERLGADSIDGTGLARYSHMRESIHRAKLEPQLSF